MIVVAAAVAGVADVPSETVAAESAYRSAAAAAASHGPPKELTFHRSTSPDVAAAAGDGARS